MEKKYLEYSEYPEPFVLYTSDSFLVNYNVRKELKDIGEQSQEVYVCEYVIVNNLDKDSIVDAMVKAKYNISQELSLLRQKEIKPEEFEEYFNYVENCKEIANDILISNHLIYE